MCFAERMLPLQLPGVLVGPARQSKHLRGDLNFLEGHKEAHLLQMGLEKTQYRVG